MEARSDRGGRSDCRDRSPHAATGFVSSSGRNRGSARGSCDCWDHGLAADCRIVRPAPALTMGALLTGFLADAGMNPNLNTNLKDVVGKTLWLEQLKAMGVTMAMAIAATLVIGYALKATIGLRPSEDDEEVGLDLSDHGERGYHTGELSHGHLDRDESPVVAAAAARLEST